MSLRFVFLLALIAVPFMASVHLAVTRASPLTSAGQAGVVTGRVVWCTPLPVRATAPGGSAIETLPGLPPEVIPDLSTEAMLDAQAPVGIPDRYPSALVPAGAVLVAVQGTALSTRTDETGRFHIEGVPAGQYLTVAAGPVRGISTATALRPNVFVHDAEPSVDLGLLSLGQLCRYGPRPLGIPGGLEVEPSPAR